MSLKLAIIKKHVVFPYTSSTSIYLSSSLSLSLPPCPSLFLLSKTTFVHISYLVVGFRSTSESVRESGEVVLLFVDVLNGPTDFDAVIVEISFINGSANGTSWNYS